MVRADTRKYDPLESSTGEAPDWDEVKEVGNSPTGICAYISSFFRRKSMQETLGDLRASSSELIASRRTRINLLELDYHKIMEQMRYYREQKDKNRIMEALKQRISTTARIQSLQQEICRVQARVHDFEDAVASDESARYLEETGRSMRKMNVEKRTRKALDAIEVIDTKNVAFNELQSVLAMPTTEEAAHPFAADDLQQQFADFMAEEVEPVQAERPLPRQKQKQKREKVVAVYE